MAVLALAKVVSIGVTAFIFDLTRPKLLQLAWFRRLYDRVMIVARLGARADRPDQGRGRGVDSRMFAPKRGGPHAAAAQRIRAGRMRRSPRVAAAARQPGASLMPRHAEWRERRTRNATPFGAVWIPGSLAAHAPRNDVQLDEMHRVRREQADAP